MKKMLHVFTFLLFSMTMGMSQPTLECQSILKEVFAKTMEVNLNKDNHLYYLEYGVITSERQPTQPVVDNRVKLLTDKNYRYIYTDQASFYIDTVHAITVVPMSKMILVNKMDEKTKSSFKQMAGLLEDSMLSMKPEILSCKNSTGNTHYDLEISIKPANANPHVEKVRYCIHSANKTIYKVILFYDKASKFSKTEYTFYKTNYNYTEKEINKPVYSLFFKSDGSLVSYYKDYKVVDQRNQIIK